jgi:hypothetical protein
MERYEPTEWPNGPQAWYDACAEWRATHPDVEDIPEPPFRPDVPWDPDMV